ncbi:MAG: flagellar hook-basal body complex protein [Clostridium butyricum]|nr:flagellar hook-basal body complex protein [Clostridium butyricum]
MLRFMYSGISGMKVNQNKLDVVGNNIANVSTTAFKGSSARFADMLYQNVGTATAPTSSKGGTNAKQVGLGAQLSSINRVMSQGNALATGRSLDACIDGEGFYIVGVGPINYQSGTKITSSQSLGAGDMKISYTRDGNFTLDKDGNLLTADGHRVMGYLLTATKKGTGEQTSPASGKSSIAIDTSEGQDVEPKLEVGDAVYVDADAVLKAVGDNSDGKTEGLQLQPLRIPEKVYVPGGENSEKGTWQSVTSFAIGKDGVITAVLANGKKTALGQIATASFTNPEGLTALGGNFYEVSPNSGSEVIRTSVNIDNDKNGKAREDNLVDNSKSQGDIIQGCLEASNVDLTEQFTDMISATRCFQASSKLITTGDEILQTITSLLR